MTELLPIASLIVAAITLLVVAAYVPSRLAALGEAQRKLDENLRLELQSANANAARSSVQLEQLRSSLQETAREDRQEVRQILTQGAMDSASKLQSVAELLGHTRDALHEDARKNREELNTSLQTSGESTRTQVTEALEVLREAVDIKLKDIQTTSTTSIERIRQTVEQKLSETLETKLAEKFETVQGYLAQVQQGLGEMKSVATEVSGLKNVLGNVSTRGNFGEVILKNLIADTLAPDQYVENYSPDRLSREKVEFAIKFPQKAEGTIAYLPVDAKFPTASYGTLLEALRVGDSEATKSARNSLKGELKKAASEIAKKYIKPPATTDIAILFLPSEGLFAEALRTEGFIEEIHRVQRVIIAGPTTFAAILNNLRLVHRDVAISQKAAKLSLSLSVRSRRIEKLSPGNPQHRKEASRSDEFARVSPKRQFETHQEAQ